MIIVFKCFVEAQSTIAEIEDTKAGKNSENIY